MKASLGLAAKTIPTDFHDDDDDDDDDDDG